MRLRVNPTILLGLVIVFVLSLGISAGAQLVGDPVDSVIGMGETVVPLPEGTDPAGGVAPAPAMEAAPVPAMEAAPVGGTVGDAIGVGEAQLGKPHVLGADGPDAFSCAGLIRYIMRTTGVDADAPMVPEGYLGRYAAVDPANMQPGDLVIYPDWATMYIGDGMLLNSNAATGDVTHTPMTEAGAPLGIVRPPYL